MDKRRLGVIEKTIKGKYQMRISKATFKSLFLKGFVVASVGCSLYILISGNTGVSVLDTVKEVLQIGLVGGVLGAWICTVVRDVSSNYLHKHLELEDKYLEFEKEELEKMLNEGKVTREEYKTYILLRRKQVQDGRGSSEDC